MLLDFAACPRSLGNETRIEERVSAKLTVLSINIIRPLERLLLSFEVPASPAF